MKAENLKGGIHGQSPCSLQATLEKTKKESFARFQKESELSFGKLAHNSLFFCFCCTLGGNRTHTVLLPLDFESSASTNSATKAISIKNRQTCFWACKYNLFGEKRNPF